MGRHALKTANTPAQTEVRIHREGTNILILLFLVLAALNVPVWLFMPPYVIPGIFTAISVVFYLFVFNFFRCPKRNYRGERDDHIVSSVDGKVVAIERVYEGEYLKSEAIMLSVFMSPLLPKASTDNERSTIGIVLTNGERITVRQIAGAMARRIVTYSRKGHKADIDGHLGFIKFGSRVDLYLPLDAEILVEMKQGVRGGVTPVARLGRKKENNNRQ